MLMWVIVIAQVSAWSQNTGTVKIFSEVKEISVYLDDEFKGNNLTSIDSVLTGTHYLKIMASEAIVYGEIITVNVGSVTTILVKNSKETQEKILQSKYEEIEEYKTKKIDIMLSSKYTTQSSGNTQSTYFPGYYIGTGYSTTTSSSTTSEVLDWFVIKGGVKKISELEFAKLTGNQMAINSIEDEQQTFKETTKAQRTAVGVVGGAVSAGGLAIGLVGLSDENLGMGFVGLAVMYVGVKILDATEMVGKNYAWKAHHMTVEQAVKDANKYNQDLKVKLGLPLDYEPSI
jgi:gas vesicle protein